jgi:hypothetical protein
MDRSKEKKLPKKEPSTRINGEEEREIIVEYTIKENTQKNMPHQCRPTQHAQENEGH